jgi:hypothetical protein
MRNQLRWAIGVALVVFAVTVGYRSWALRTGSTVLTAGTTANSSDGRWGAAAATNSDRRVAADAAWFSSSGSTGTAARGADEAVNVTPEAAAQIAVEDARQDDPEIVPVTIAAKLDPATARLRAVVHNNSPRTLPLTITVLTASGDVRAQTQLTAPPASSTDVSDPGLVVESGDRFRISSPRYLDRDQ